MNRVEPSTVANAPDNAPPPPAVAAMSARIASDDSRTAFEF